MHIDQQPSSVPPSLALSVFVGTFSNCGKDELRKMNEAIQQLFLLHFSSWRIEYCFEFRMSILIKDCRISLKIM